MRRLFGSIIILSYLSKKIETSEFPWSKHMEATNINSNKCNQINFSSNLHVWNGLKSSVHKSWAINTTGPSHLSRVFDKTRRKRLKQDFPWGNNLFVLLFSTLTIPTWTSNSNMHTPFQHFTYFSLVLFMSLQVKGTWRKS